MYRASVVIALLVAACSTSPAPPEGEAPAHCAELDSSSGTTVVSPDELPRPVDLDHIYFPNHLRQEPVEGEAVVEIKLAEDGEVLSATVVESDLPDDFTPFLEREVESWRFTEPTVNGGCPIKAQARITIPVTIR